MFSQLPCMGRRGGNNLADFFHQLHRLKSGTAGKASTAATWSMTPSIVYVFMVRLMSECRASNWAVFGAPPVRVRFVMNVFRKAWRPLSFFGV